MSLTRNSFIFAIPFLLFSPFLSSCGTSSENDVTYLKVLNSEDYIYKKEEDDDPEDLTVQFEEYIFEKTGKKVRVIYDTFDTMENMFNTIKTGKTNYDLICASDYMIQKLYSTGYIEGAGNSMLTKLDYSKIPNYDNFCSNFIRENLKSIPMKNNENMDEYCNCYMWGTLGIIYNPTYFFNKYEVNPDTNPDRADEIVSELSTDLMDLNMLWDKKYQKTISIKDSMRDTYALGLIHTYEEELRNAEGDKDERFRIFNYGSEDDPDAAQHIKAVQQSLLELRNNIFGFEVDSGKEDIVTGKIGIDTAWSGDAVYSMDQAEEEKDMYLYYSIPKQGTNLWFDCWAMTSQGDEAQKDLAYEFLNFLADPVNVIQNVEYIGYTSAIAGEEMFAYYNEAYSTEEEEEAVPYDLNYFFENDDSEADYTIYADSLYFDRQLHAQFPKVEEIDNLMIMKDYGNNSDLILRMWEQVKHESLPTWAIALFVVEIAAITTAISIFAAIKISNKKRRTLRRAKTIKTN